MMKMRSPLYLSACLLLLASREAWSKDLHEGARDDRYADPYVSPPNDYVSYEPLVKVEPSKRKHGTAYGASNPVNDGHQRPRGGYEPTYTVPYTPPYDQYPEPHHDQYPRDDIQYPRDDIHHPHQSNSYAHPPPHTYESPSEHESYYPSRNDGFYPDYTYIPQYPDQSYPEDDNPTLYQPQYPDQSCPEDDNPTLYQPQPILPKPFEHKDHFISTTPVPPRSQPSAVNFDHHTVSGTVRAGGHPVPYMSVVLAQMGRSRGSVVVLGGGKTSSNGRYEVTFTPMSERIKTNLPLYVLAANGELRVDSPKVPSVVLVSLLPGPQHLYGVYTEVPINEYTTAAIGYGLAQFTQYFEIYGPSPALENAVAMTMNLVDPTTGGPGSTIRAAENGPATLRNRKVTQALPVLNTVANAIASCAHPKTSKVNCTVLFGTTTPANGPRPRNTWAAAVSLGRDPVMMTPQKTFEFFTLAKSSGRNQPALEAVPPQGFVLALLFKGGDLCGPLKPVVDSYGRLIVLNQYLSLDGLQGVDEKTGHYLPGRQITIMDPETGYIPEQGGVSSHILGPEMGAALSHNKRKGVWVSNFAKGAAGSSVMQFDDDMDPVFKSSTRAGGVDHPLAIAVDPKNQNTWIACYGNPSSGKDHGRVVLYPGGDPSKAVYFNDPEVIAKPVGVAVDKSGHAWVADRSGGVSILRLSRNSINMMDKIPGTNHHETVLPGKRYSGSGAIVLDSNGHGWVTNYGSGTVVFIYSDNAERHIPVRVKLAGGRLSGPYDLAVDSEDNVWVTDFNQRRVIKITRNGNSFDQRVYTNGAFELVGGITVDSAGVVWVTNDAYRDSAFGTRDAFVPGDSVVALLGVAKS